MRPLQQPTTDGLTRRMRAVCPNVVSAVCDCGSAPIPIAMLVYFTCLREASVPVELMQILKASIISKDRRGCVCVCANVCMGARQTNFQIVDPKTDTIIGADA